MNLSSDELRRWQLYGQHLTAKTTALEATSHLCGFQAQYPANARQAARLRAKRPPDGTGLVKSWTLRGTLHIVPLEDLPLYCSQDDPMAGSYLRWLGEHRSPIPRRRWEWFSRTVLDGLSQGPRSREELRALCLQAGMTPEEEEILFDGWGGLVRVLCEGGLIYCDALLPKTYCLCPPLRPVSRDQAQLTLVQRYLSHYGPATLEDAAYFFRWPKKRLSLLLNQLEAQTLSLEGRTYYYPDRRPARLPKIPDCLFLAGFDPLLLGYEKKQSLYLPPACLRRVFNLTGIVFPTLLLHGQVAGVWKELPRAIRLTAFSPLSPEDREAARLACQSLWPEKSLTILEE